jgi:hypothetical protein
MTTVYTLCEYVDTSSYPYFKVLNVYTEKSKVVNDAMTKCKMDISRFQTNSRCRPTSRDMLSQLKIAELAADNAKTHEERYRYLSLAQRFESQIKQDGGNSPSGKVLTFDNVQTQYSPFSLHVLPKDVIFVAGTDCSEIFYCVSQAQLI